MIEVNVEGHRLHILPVIKGLVSEADKVQDAFQKIRPRRALVSLSPEQLFMLGAKEQYHEYEPSMLEAAYAYFLDRFGSVEIPPPCYVRAYDLCQQEGVELLPLDMDEDSFTELYCEKVGTMEMFRESRFAKKAPKKRFDLSSPEAFVKDWDAKVNASRGFRSLEKARESYMADMIRRHATADALVLMELERLEGVRTRLA
jgi:hypothetical protein